MLSFFFFNDTATTEIYTLSLHDALPISYTGGYSLVGAASDVNGPIATVAVGADGRVYIAGDRKSTRLNSSHVEISYAVFCLKKKKKYIDDHLYPVDRNLYFII